MKLTSNVLIRFRRIVLLTMILLPPGITTNAGYGKTGALLVNEATRVYSSDEVAVLTRFDVKQGRISKYKKLIYKYVRQAIKRDGNIMAEAFYEQDSVSVLWIIERWSSRVAFERSRADKKFGLLQGLSSKESVQSLSIYVKDLEPISKEQWRVLPGKADQPITIMLFVDSKPGTEKTFQTVYHIAMPQFRSEPGVINYQLSQLNTDSTRFVTYEKFRNEDAFQYHLKFPPIQPVIDYLNTSIKEQPFQKGLHRLIEFAPSNRN